MPFPAFFRRKFSVNKMKENTISRCLFYISSVFGKVQYGKKVQQSCHQAKGETCNLQTGKDTIFMRKIY